MPLLFWTTISLSDSTGVASSWQFALAIMLPWKSNAFVVAYTSETASELQAEPVLPPTTSRLEHRIGEGWSCACGIVATSTWETGNYLSSEFYFGDRNSKVELKTQKSCHISTKLQKSVKKVMGSHTKEWQTLSIRIYLGPSIITADVPGPPGHTSPISPWSVLALAAGAFYLKHSSDVVWPVSFYGSSFS